MVFDGESGGGSCASAFLPLGRLSPSMALESDGERIEMKGARQGCAGCALILLFGAFVLLLIFAAIVIGLSSE